MQQESVAILLAVYNGERYLNDLLHSLLAQTYSDFRIYVRDNCSTDATGALLQTWKERHPHKIELLQAESNMGCVANFSFLLNYTTAPYVMFCDHDDVWLPHKIALTLQKMEELEERHGKSHPIAIHTDLSIVDEELNMLASSLWKRSHLNTSLQCYSFARLLVQNQITGCTLMMNRALVDIANPIPLKCMMHDWWIALVACCFGVIGRVNQSTVLYRQHGSNDTGARPYGLLPFFRRRKKEKVLASIGPGQVTGAAIGVRGKIERKIEQTELFIHRYQNLLPSRQVKIALAYLKMQHSSFPKAVALLLRYRFFKTGFLRNFILNH